MKLNTVLYIDIESVSNQIKDTINVDTFGNIIFKKNKLKDFHFNLYNTESHFEFIYINSTNDLETICNQIEYSENSNYLIHLSNVVVVNKEGFRIFLEKINYAPVSFILAEFENPKGLLKLTKVQTIEFLKTYSINGPEKSLTQLANQKNTEKLNLETFFIQIDGYADIVRLFQTNFELRYFNSIEKKENIITKKSTDKAKMLAEYSYYNLLSDELKIYFLPTFGYTETETHASYSLEKLQIPDVSLQWIHLSFSDQEFKQLLTRLFKFIKLRPIKDASKELIASKIKDYFLTKVLERFEKLKKDPKYLQINDFTLSITGFKTIDELFDIYIELYNKHESNIIKNSNLCMSHGDLCFSNMIYDKRIDLLKLIDPKGGIKNDDIYLPNLYDIAKLSHSIMGKYDFINNALYDFSFNENLRATLKIDNLNVLKSKEHLFKEALEKNGFDYKIVRLLEASLFLSMLPLHLDNSKKVTAFILNANQILNELK